MTKGILKINNKNAYSEWGISLTDEGLSSLMTPPNMKPYVTSKSRLRNGTTYGSYVPKYEEREVTLSLVMSAKDEGEFVSRLDSFYSELAKGNLKIEYSILAGKVYHMVYVSCSQFTQFYRGIAKFSLKLNEPDPSKRS